jgi:ribonuclease Z
METCIQVPSYKLCFDIGRCPPSAARRRRVLFTHGHVDHMGGVAHHASLRELWGMSPPEYWVPDHYGDAFDALLDAWRRLSHGPLPAEVRRVTPGEEVELGGGRRVRTFRSVHRVHTLGYALFAARSKLKPELVGLPGPEIAARRAAGEAVTTTREECEVVFCGDTTIDVVDREPLVRTARVLVLECTFVDGDVSRARRTGHVHLDQIVERAELFENEAILLTHFSVRYHPRAIQRMLDRKLPAHLRERVTALLPGPPYRDAS